MIEQEHERRARRTTITIPHFWGWFAFAIVAAVVATLTIVHPLPVPKSVVYVLAAIIGLWWLLGGLIFRVRFARVIGKQRRSGLRVGGWALDGWQARHERHGVILAGGALLDPHDALMRHDAARYRTAIAAALPALTIHTFHFLAEGWDSAVWEVNGDLVFRFPKRAEVGTWLRREIALLPLLGPTLPTPIPRFAYIADDANIFPYPFVGYRKLPGVPLAERSPAITAPGRLAAQIGRFLTALHRLPTDRAVACGVPDASPATWRAQYVAMLADLRALFPRLTPTERAQTETLFAAYLDNPALVQFAPVLLHRDLGSDHLLLDPRTGDLAAVIDWGDASIGDPAQDFCGLPTAWLPALLASYGGAVDATFAQRVAFYRSLGPYHTLIFGLRAGGEPFIEQGLAELRG